jgi:pilus assembly protein CpaF
MTGLAEPVPGLTARVRQRLARSGEPADPVRVAQAVREESRTVVLGPTALRGLASRTHQDLVGAGPLAPLLADPSVTDVLVNGPDEVWVDRGAGLERVPLRLGGAQDVRLLAQRLAAAGGRRLDDASPCADVRLADGTRLHAGRSVRFAAGRTRWPS